ncbi:MAG: glycosyltransferase family 39 protein [Bacteroidales bacterium]
MFPSSPLGRSLALPAALVALALALFTVTWGIWPDAIVDVGRELYVPWRLAQGDMLYRDVAWLNGPLSPYFNALVFRALGVGLWSLVVANLALLAVLSLLVFRLCAALTTRVAAATAVAVLLSVFGFAQLEHIGGYNFLCPYSHELTHGLLLVVATLYSMHLWTGRNRRAHAFAAGLFAGLACLTKPETAIAAAAVVLTYGACVLVARHVSPRARLQHGGWIVAGFAIPIVTAVLLLGSGLGLGAAISALLVPWRAVVSPDVRALAFYQLSAGLDEPFPNTVRMLKWSAIYLSAALVALLCGRVLDGAKAAAAWSARLGVVVAGVTAAVFSRATVYEAGSGLPLVACAGLMFGVVTCRKEDGWERGALLCGFSAAALALLMKTPLAARVHHYGFVLGLPAALLLVLFLVDCLPRLAARRGGSARAVQCMATGIVAGCALVFLTMTLHAVDVSSASVAAGSDRFYSDSRGAAVDECRRILERQLASADTVAVLPEGVMLNYLLRRRSTVRYVNYMPLELLLFREDRVLSALQSAPPSAIVLVHKDTSEYGYPLFGTDYGTSILRWVRENYDRTALIGHEPLRSPAEFGIEVLRRRDGARRTLP